MICCPIKIDLLRKREDDSYVRLVKSKSQAFVKMQVCAKECGLYLENSGSIGLFESERRQDHLRFCKDAMALKWWSGVREV